MDKKFIIKYNDESFKSSPHIVSFSGGRSSGMVVMEMLKNGILDPVRGDCVIFNNTSAEHIETYKFVNKISEIVEDFGVPFFFIEFDTYEYQWQDRKSRRFTYRLAKPNPEDQEGYKTDGSVFEHSISWNRFLPNRHSRVCTAYLKGEVTRMFKDEWLSDKNYVEHVGPNESEPSITNDDLRVNFDKFSKGGTFEDYVRLSKYAYSMPANRNRQIYSDYSRSGKRRFTFSDKRHVDILGIRAEEWRRISKIKENRTNAIMPLVDSNITKNDVIEYWSKQSFDLNLPDTGMWSNCVFCPIKSWETLKTIEKHNHIVNSGREVNAPSNIEWWIDIENKYQKPTRKGAMTGFFGVQREGRKKENFQRLKEESESTEQDGFQVTEYLSCECGD